MNINNPSGQSIATSVWANVTRTLTADPATDAGAATFVWTHATRTLTSLGVQTAIGAVAQAIANGATVDLRPASGRFRHAWVNYVAITNAAGQIGQYDGATFTSMASQFASNSGNQDRMTVGNNAHGQALQNNGTTGTTYSYTGWDW